jgi:hypothetical protein
MAGEIHRDRIEADLDILRQVNGALIDKILESRSKPRMIQHDLDKDASSELQGAISYIDSLLDESSRSKISRMLEIGRTGNINEATRYFRTGRFSF